MFTIMYKVSLCILLISRFTTGTQENINLTENSEYQQNVFKTIRKEYEIIGRMAFNCYHCQGLYDCITPGIVECGKNEKYGQMCFTSFDDKNRVKEKGCKYDLALEAIERKSLIFCAGSKCNIQNSSIQATKCISCISSVDPNCASKPKDMMSFENCLTPSHCFSRLDKSGNLERGCTSNLNESNRQNCFDVNFTHCAVCSTNLCNHHNFSEVISIKFDKTRTIKNNMELKSSKRIGIWQDLPLKCYTCEGKTSCKLELKDTKVCELNNEQDCMTVFTENGEVISRGCSDQVEEAYGEYCSEKEDRCYSCQSNGCNTANSTASYKSCIDCKSSETEACIWNSSDTSLSTRMCQSDCMVVLHPVDLSEKPAYELIRSCLDDMEVINQTECSTGNNKMCKACNKKNCNKMDVDVNRLKCFICSGNDCEVPESLTCPLFKENDKCFIWFDQTNSIKEMGCLSSLPNISIESLYLTKRVFVCDSGDNCNDQDKLQQSQKCAQCTSSQDLNCAVDPISVTTHFSCTQLPYTDCSSFVTTNGETVRGCLSDLPPKDYVSCLMGNNDNCSLCIGDGCNRKIFPKNRLQCYTCSSKDDPNCESFPEKTMPCPYLRPDEYCVTALSGNETERGCASQLLCDVHERASCRHCSKSGCNTVDLKNLRYDDDVGRWQNLPLRCHTCSEELCQNSLGPALTCTGNDRQVCVTVFDENGNVKRRGCSDDIEDYEDVYCRKNAEKCLRCKSNQCNVAWNITDFVDCVYCDSKKDPSCAIYPENYTALESRKCFKSCMAAVNGSHIVRSCLDDMEWEASAFMCKNNAVGHKCAKCTGNFCNTFIFPADRLKCHKCTDAWCKDTIVEYCPLYEMNDACFAKYEVDDQVYYMGCESSENYQNLIEWRNKKQLFSCSKNECNAKHKLPYPQLCINCNSLKTTECAIKPSSIDRASVCAPPFSQCFTKITQDGATHRGCMGDLSLSEIDACDGTLNLMCNKCDGNHCNNEIFPKQRRSCHICNNHTCDNTMENRISVCPVYASNDKCIVKKDENGLIEQGCLTEMSCITTDSKMCAICDYDACNRRDLISTAGLSTVISFPLIILTVLPYKVIEFIIGPYV